MSEYLGHDKRAPVTNNSGNAHNGKSRKNLMSEFGQARCGLHTHRTHPVNFLDNRLIEIMVGIGVIAVWMVGTTDLF